MNRSLVTAAACAWLAAAGRAQAEGMTVELLKTPHGGLQPQAVVDAEATLHLLYFAGDPGQGDLFYLRKEAAQEDFSKPVRVNSQPSSAVATGTIRGGQIALGQGGRIHVAWNGRNGSSKAAGAHGAPMFYTRSNDEGTAFEEQRNLMRDTTGLDGGGTVAADGEGNVYVAWHGLKAGEAAGEANRRVWIVRSDDGGATFSSEAPAWDTRTGCCACCATRAFADSSGALHLLYRSATDDVNRDMYLLRSGDRGRSFEGTLLHRWRSPG
jgi:hypothetical protein